MSSTTTVSTGNDDARLPIAAGTATSPRVPVGSAPPSWSTYVAGGATETGETIKVLVHSTPTCAIFVNEEGMLRWRVDHDKLPSAHGAIAEATDLQNQARSGVLSERARQRSLFVIGVALARAFEDIPSPGITDYFATARAFITARRREALHMFYLFAAISMGLVLVATTLGFRSAGSPLEPFFVAAALGAAGAVVSVLQRFRDINIETYTSRVYTATAGVSRTVFGAAFGVVLLLLHKSDLVLSVAKTNPSFIALACFVAGFSERMIPELLARIEQSP